MRSTFRTAHRYLSLCVGAVWLLQAISGTLLVFHRSWDDHALGASGRHTELKVIDSALTNLARRTPGARVVQYFPSGGVAGQIDVLIEREGGRLDVVRIDGATGSVLRNSAWEHPLADLTFFRFVLLLHKQMLSGEIGRWFIGLSGALLLLNIVLGLRLAWPVIRNRGVSLLPKAKTQAAALFGWHRAIGLYLAPLGLVIVFTGVLIVWIPELERVLGASVAPPPASPFLQPNERVISPSAAAEAALRLYDDATIAVVSMPDNRRPWYSIRVRQPGELRRVYGTTLVYVDARTGAVLKTRDALKASAQTRFLAALWPVHIGDWGGIVTRFVTLATGLWLATIAVLGFALWWTRHRVRGS